MNKAVFRLTVQILVMLIVISVLLLFLGIGILISIHICVVGRSYGRNNMNPNNGAIRVVGRATCTSLSKEEIEKLPCYDYILKSKGSSSPADDCAVCLDNFKKGDKCRLLPFCNHSFHADCVDAWLLKTPNCPVCRSAANSQRFVDKSGRFGEDIVGGIELREREEQPAAESNSNIQLSSSIIGTDVLALSNSTTVEIVQ